MAILTALPSSAIIKSLDGVIDFYYWKGIPVARKYPHWRKRAPYPAEKANQDDFRFVTQFAPTMPIYLKNQFKRMAEGTDSTWKDMLVQAYMAGMRVSPYE